MHLPRSSVDDMLQRCDGGVRQNSVTIVQSCRLKRCYDICDITNEQVSKLMQTSQLKEASLHHLCHLGLHAQITVKVDAKVTNWLQNVSAYCAVKMTKQTTEVPFLWHLVAAKMAIFVEFRSCDLFWRRGMWANYYASRRFGRGYPSLQILKISRKSVHKLLRKRPSNMHPESLRIVTSCRMSHFRGDPTQKPCIMLGVSCKFLVYSVAM